MIFNLMIGNYVQLKSNKELIVICGIDLNGVTSHLGTKFKFDEIEGIPLNENWLLKFKFSTWEGKYNSKTYTKGSYVLHLRKRGYVTKKSEGVVSFIHELQNRFYVTRSKHLK